MAPDQVFVFVLLVVTIAAVGYLSYSSRRGS